MQGPAVLQSRLFRTPDDIESLADLAPSVRICIGIYQEPPEFAVTDRPNSPTNNVVR